MSGVVPYPVRTDAPGLLVAKLHPPAVPVQTVPRERLLERLRSGSDRKLTLLAAPAGSGKITLLAKVFHHVDHPMRTMGQFLAQGRAPSEIVQLYASHAKHGRNDPCTCGSGLKWKRCHGAPPHGGL